MKTAPASADILAQITTLGDLFTWRVLRTPHGEAYRECDLVTGDWVSHTWSQMAERIEKWRDALDALHLPDGARVAILLPNGIDAVCIDQASLASGLVPVPMHAIDNPESIAYIVQDCGASVLMVSTRAQWDALAAVSTNAIPLLKLVVLAGETISAKGESQPLSPVAVVALQDWLACDVISKALRKTDLPGEALAAIVYTSGTTGKPKGVMLTHNNVLGNIRAVLARVSVAQTDVFLSFLPLSHTFERTIGYYLAIAAGSCVAYTRSVAQIAEDLKIVRPTVLVSVPRIYERFHAALQEKLGQSGWLTRWIFKLTQTIGWRRFCLYQKIPHDAGPLAFLDPLLSPLLHHLVARKVLAQFGGRLRCAVCGGAPLSQSVAQCFLGLGLPLMQGYGMTETSPVVCANAIDDNWPTTVGRALDGVEVRIGDNHELQVRGNGLMKGYWNRPEESAHAISEDGWLRTGDQAAIEDGRIRIVGRIKEIIVTSTGEKISPAGLELAIAADPLFEQVFVVGENRPFIAAIVVLNRGLWEKLAQHLKVEPSDSASMDSQAVCSYVLGKIQQAAKSFPSYAVPRAVRMTLEPWSIQNGLMTPTLKLKRNALQTLFNAEIEEIYSQRSAKSILNQKRL